MADKRSFEEQVRDKLADFEIAPEAFVWNNVESSLQKDKKRRWIIWLFLFAIIGSAASYWMYHQFKAPGTIETKQVTASKAIPAGKTAEVLTTKPSGIKENIVTEKTVSAVPAELLKSKDKIFTNKKLAKEVSSREVQKSIDQPVTASMAVNKNEEDNKAQEAPAGGSSMENKKDSATVISDAPLTANEQKPIITIPLADTATSSQSAITGEKSVTAKKGNRWKFYAIADLGQSGLWYKNFYVNANVNAVAPPSGAVTPSIYSEAKSRSAFSFGAGIDAERILSKKWDIGISLTYQHYASKINVGRKVNNVLGFQNSFNNTFALTSSGYYIGSAEETYINRYHLLETGLSFYRNYKLGNSFSLRWQLGAAGAWLFTSNALHYDEAQNIQYKDNSLLHRFQLNLSTGLEAGIGKAQRIFVGPQFTYFPTTNSVQTSQYDYRHLVRIGLRTHILLAKNKKKK